MAKIKTIIPKPVLVNIDESHFLYLKRSGINRSKFVRQAIESHKKGEWEYNYED